MGIISVKYSFILLIDVMLDFFLLEISKACPMCSITFHFNFVEPLPCLLVEEIVASVHKRVQANLSFLLPD